MKKVDFLIFYEHKNREFESIVLLKHELVKRGYTVEFWSFYENDKKKRKALFNNVNIAVMPSLYHDEEILSFVYSIAGRVKNIVNLRWEQLFSKNMENNLDYYVYPKGNAKNGYHLCWGERPYEILCLSGVDKSKLFITGPIHMDFLRHQLRGFYYSRYDLFKRYGLDPDKKCVLFTSSFVVSSYNKAELEWFFSQYDKKEQEYYRNFLVRERDSKNIIAEWLTMLAKEKNCTVIYRPHPAEVKSKSIEQLKQTPNICVIDGENIKQWILTCDQVYTWHSTSLAEASVAGIPCAVLRPVDLDEGEEYSIYQDIPYISSFQRFSEYFDNNTGDNLDLFVNGKQLTNYLSIDPKTPSYIRIADVLEQSLYDSYYFPWNNFSDEQFRRERERIKKQYRLDAMAKLLIKPFYGNPFTKRVVSRLFSKQYYQYCSYLGNKSRVIPNDEFIEIERRVSSVISKNRDDEK